MKSLLLYLVKSLTDCPEKVSVEESHQEGTVTLSLKVAQQDMGKIIGKQGKIIKALRDVVKILAVKDGRRINIELVEDIKPQVTT